jgi:hypothetical protein
MGKDHTRITRLAQNHIRAARPNDAGILSAIAIRSKAHWGYDQEFMAACRDELTLTTAPIARDPTFLVEREGTPLGFYRLTIEPDNEVDVAAFDPNAVGFYEAMGARRIGSVPSVSIPDRSLPLLAVSLGDLPDGTSR